MSEFRGINRYHEQSKILDPLTNSMELNPSSEVTSCVSTQEFPNILWNSNVHHRVHKIPPLISILSQMKPVHNIPSYLSKIFLILSTHLRLGIPSGLCPSGFITKILYSISFFPMRATCPVHLILLDLMVLIILGVEYKL
jgi:hypothetical protein